MSQITIFISAVSDEFAEEPSRFPDRVDGAGDYRTYLRDKLTCHDVCVKVQEDFIAGGVLTLDKLAIYLNECDAVIHIVGDMTGAAASSLAVESLFEKHSDLAHSLPFLSTPAEALKLGLSYTQWEAYLAVYFGKRLVVCTPQSQSPRAGKFASTELQRMSQSQHLARLKTLKRHPEISFGTREELTIEVLRMLRTILPSSKRELIPSPPSRLPYAPLGELFIGRDSFLQDIRDRFQRAREKGQWPKQVVRGLGGMGKTRLAVEYAWRNRDQYTAVLLVNGESKQSLERDLASLLGVFHLQCADDTSEPERMQMAVDWLREHPGWLMIVDNVDTSVARKAVTEWLPQWNDGHVLITARVSDWPRDVEPLDLHVLAPKDAQKFLLEATDARRRKQPDDDQQSFDLANTELGALCLALEQSAAYINKLPNISFADYRQRWSANLKQVRSKAFNELMHYHEGAEVSWSVQTTWLTSFEQLSPVARTLLQIFAWLAPDPLPLNLVRHEKLEQQVRELGGDPDADVEFALAELLSYSLVMHAPAASESAGQVHRLVQLITRDSSTPQHQRATLSAAMKSLGGTLPADLHDDASDVDDDLGPHLATLIAHADAAGVVDGLPRLLLGYASLLEDKAYFAEAEVLLRRALTLDEEMVGPNDPRVAEDLHALANLLLFTDRKTEAEALYRRALAIDEQHYGAEHFKTAERRSALGLLLQMDNRAGEAESEAQMALQIAEKAFGKDQPGTVAPLLILARIYWYSSQLKKSESILRRIVAIQKKRFGEQHTEVASACTNLAVVLKEMESFPEAETLLRAALAIESAAFGPEHPTVAITLNNLGQILERTNRGEEAERVFRQALSINERTMGVHHSHVARDLANLALLLAVARRHAEAEPLLRRAIEINKRSLGERHPELATNLNNLATMLIETERLEEAEALARSALAIDESSFSADHPKIARDATTLATALHRMNRLADEEALYRRILSDSANAPGGCDDSRTNSIRFDLARLLMGADRNAEAEPLLRQALAAYEQSKGQVSLLVGVITLDLAIVLKAMNRLDEAEPLIRRSLAVFKKLNGDTHPHVANGLSHLGRLLQQAGRSDEAEGCLREALAIYQSCCAPDSREVADANENLARFLTETRSA